MGSHERPLKVQAVVKREISSGSETGADEEPEKEPQQLKPSPSLIRLDNANGDQSKRALPPGSGYTGHPGGQKGGASAAGSEEAKQLFPVTTPLRDVRFTKNIRLERNTSHPEI